MTHAGLWTRLMAHNIDLIILLPFYYLFSFLIASDHILLVVCFLVSFFYEVTLTSLNGGTVGKRMMKLKVTNNSLQNISFFRSLLRSSTKLISGFLFFLGFAIIELNQQKKGLHDMLSGTFVIISSNN